MATVKPWMAIYTKPRNEKKVAERLTKAGFDNYLPLQEQKRKWSDRYKTVKVPVISSYVFVKAEESDRNKILQDPGVLNFVFWLGKPATITEEEINKVKYILGEAGSEYEIEMHNFLPGDQIEIDEGKFAGQTGKILHSSKKEISVVLKGLGLVLRLTPLHVKKKLSY